VDELQLSRILLIYERFSFEKTGDSKSFLIDLIEDSPATTQDFFKTRQVESAIMPKAKTR